MGTLALTQARGIGPTRAFLVAVVLAGFAFALWAEATRLDGGWPLDWVLVDVVPGLAFLVAGAVAWARRPDSRIGPVMILTGFAWYPGTLTASTEPQVARLGSAFQGWFDGLLAWLVLAYPSGRLVGRAAKVVVAAVLATLAVRTAFRFATFRMSTDYDFTVPTEADRFIADMALRQAGDTLLGGIVAGLMLAVLVLLLRRVVVETRLARRIAWPMLVAGIAVATGVVVKFWTIFTATSTEDRFGAWDLADGVTAATGAGVAIAFLVGRVRGRIARQSVADLVLGLGDAGGRAALRDVIARALRDPSAELLYPGEGGRYQDATGAERSVPEPGDGDRATAPIAADGRALAVLVYEPAIAEQPELLRSVIAAVRLALENERLAAEVRSQLAEVHASRARIVAAGDEQRRRIERDLHDGAQQRLVTLALRLEAAREAASPEEPAASRNPELAAALEAATRDLDAAISELRELARGLHPAALAADGLRSAIEALCDRTPIPVEVEVTDDRFPEPVEAAAYFVVAEALTNVVRYASATEASVTIAEVGGRLIVEVTDDGIGGADPSRGTGLRGLEDRLAAVGGQLTVISAAGAGTTVRAELPCG